MQEMMMKVFDPTPRSDSYDNNEEYNVINGPETQIAHDLGEDPMTDHGGEFYPTDDPTSAKEVTNTEDSEKKGSKL